MADALPTRMTAVEIAEPGGPEVLRPTPRDLPVPQCGRSPDPRCRRRGQTPRT